MCVFNPPLVLCLAKVLRQRRRGARVLVIVPIYEVLLHICWLDRSCSSVFMTHGFRQMCSRLNSFKNAVKSVTLSSLLVSSVI